jgi:hypothetical protein
MVILPIHSSRVPTIGCHLLQPFKNAIKKVRNSVMAKSKYLELNKVTLIEWVDKWVANFLQQSLKKDNIKSKFMVCKI